MTEPERLTPDERIDLIRDGPTELAGDPNTQYHLETMPLTRNLLAYAQNLVDLHAAYPDKLAALITDQEEGR